MRLLRTLSNEEFDRDWADIGRRVLGGENLIIEIDDRLFAATGWKRTAIPDSLPFTGCDSFDPFPYPKILELEDYYDPLFATLAERGIHEICISTMGVCGKLAEDGNIIPHNHHVVCRPDAISIKSALGMDVYCDNSLMFSREGNWGLVSTMDDCSILAGEPDFMEDFFRHAGGEDLQKLRFYWFADTHKWTLDYHIDMPAIGELFRIAGWPVPEFTNWPLEDPSEPLSDEALLEVPRPAWTRLYRDETSP